MSDNQSIQTIPIIIGCVCVFVFLKILFLLIWYCKRNMSNNTSENRISIQYINNPLDTNKVTITTSHTSIQINPFTHSPPLFPEKKQHKIFIMENDHIQMTPVKVNRLNKK